MTDFETPRHHEQVIAHLLEVAADHEDRLSKVERLREIVWEVVKFLWKDGFKMLLAALLFAAMFTGKMKWDQIQKLIEVLSSGV